MPSILETARAILLHLDGRGIRSMRSDTGQLCLLIQNPVAARANLNMAQTLAPHLFEPFYNGGEWAMADSSLYPSILLANDA